jgi:Ca-activated chloride channel family protein
MSSAAATDGTTTDDEGSSTTGDGSASDSENTSGDATTGPNGSTSTTGDPTTGPDSGSAGDAIPGYGGDDEVCDADQSTSIELDLPDSNAMVSPVQARMAVLDGWGVFGDLFIRPWEFLAYYPFDYPAAAPGELAVQVELFAPKDQPEGSYELQIGVTGPWMSAAERPPLDLTLVLDVSGSMKGVPVMLLKDACMALLGELRAGDRVSIVTWTSEEPALIAYHKVAGPLDPTLVDLVENLEATGGSDLYAGLSAGYQLAAEIYDPERVSRVILMSDGGAAADTKALDLIAAHATDDGEAEGIHLVGVGVGTYGGYQPALMDSVAAVGGGPTLFIGSTDEATATLGERFLGLMLVAARDLTVNVTLPPGFRRRLPEEFVYEDTKRENLGQPLRQNESLVYFERLASCDPDEVDSESPLKVKVEYFDTQSYKTESLLVETTFGELQAKGVTQLHKGAAIVRYSEALRLWNEAPGAPDAYISAAEAALGRASLAEVKLPQDASLAEIQAVLKALLESLQ